MDVDPSNNVVIFRYKRMIGAGESVHGVTTRVIDGIQQAWKLAVQDGVKQKKVVEIFSEWSATNEDEQFLRTEFPNIDFSYIFTRPAADDDASWETAFDGAVKTIMSEAMGTGHLPDEPMLVPILRNDDEDNILTQSMLHQKLGSSGLVMTLGNVAPTERGTIGVDWVMAASVPEEEHRNMFLKAIENLQTGIEIQAGETENGEKIASVGHPCDHGASAICLPGFFEQAANWVGSKNIIVGIPDCATLLLAAADSQVASKIKETVMESECLEGQPLTPCVFEYRDDNLNRIATHPNG